MSGICGICKPNEQTRVVDLDPMFGGLRVRGERPPVAVSTMGAAFGAAPRWEGQSVWRGNEMAVAVSADLCNLKQLTAELKDRCDVEAGSSAELVGGLYRKYGLAFLEKLEGSFGLALWDGSRQELMLAVDPLGLEPLYWAEDGDRLLFSSRVGSIAQAKPDCELDPTVMMQFLLYTVVPAPASIYRGVQRLEPGTLLVWRNGVTTQRRYWDMKYEESAGQKPERWAEQLRDHMRRAVHSHLEGCGPEHSGAYLSGGTDSSSVVAFASERYPSFNAFSIYFDNPKYDELAFARIAATRFNAKHHQSCLTADDATHAITAIIDYYDEPFGNPSAIGSYHCARLAQQHGVDVLLAGDGGDELFAGNERYASDKRFALYHSLPHALRSGIVEPVARMLPSSGPLSLPARYIRRAQIPNPSRIWSYSFFLSNPLDEIFEHSFLRSAAGNSLMDVAKAHYQRAPEASSELNRLLYLDVKMTLADNDIRKVKGTAEMAGVKVRFPLLDKALAEFSGRIPSALKLKGFEKRYIFKKAMEGILPTEILKKKKHGFGVPVGYWAMHDSEMQSLVDILDEPETRQRGYFKPEFLREIKKLNETYPAYYGDVMWALVMLEMWHRRHYKKSAVESLEVGAAHAS